MSIAIIHLSDFHNIQGRHENHAVVVKALFEDLPKQLDQLKAKKVFIAFSGDIAQGGDEWDQYQDFHNAFDLKLNSIGIGKNQRICVPGNHDLSRKHVESNFIVHEGVVSQRLSEQRFNDFVLKIPNVLTEKFSNYLNFQLNFADFGLKSSNPTGAGWLLSDDIGLYCLNTALCSSGGIEQGGKPVNDKRRLRIETRTLYDWLKSCNAKCKILLMHHPLHWLDEASEAELKIILKNNFQLTLFGHEHEQNSLHSISEGNSLIQCCAPALFTRKDDQLGYSIVSIDGEHQIRQLIYRQWTKNHKFVSGVNFSNNDNGKILFHKNLLNEVQSLKTDFVLNNLNRNLDDALISFSGQPKVWVQPIIKKTPEIEKDEKSKESIDLNELLNTPISSVFRAPPQFGLTCLARYLIRESWIKHEKLWLYLDASALKPTNHSIKETVARELSTIGLAHSEIKCIVIDSIGGYTKDAWKIFRKIVEIFPTIPIFCMQTMNLEDIFEQSSDNGEIPADFQVFYLWTLSRTHIRTIISEYNEARHVGEENTVITRIVSDLDVLNLHRTPLNCLTLLKASEVDFDESPVNRSEMIKRVLFLLFNVDELPTYKTRPDLKDCEHVLGYFCEKILKEKPGLFSRTFFLNALQKYCRESFIDLEVQVVFDVLVSNHILVEREGQFAFKFAFWIYYFAALRMHHDSEFAKFILSDMRYANYPELIEFYTGIDRQREDALIVLTEDLAITRKNVEEQCGFPEDMDPYRLAQWNPSTAGLEQMEAEIQEGVKQSNLPAEIKDHFADREYDAKRPYDQSIKIMTDSSLICMMQTLRAASKALRNSDYVKPEIKRLLLKEILHCWQQLSIVLLVVMPALAAKGSAMFDGALFELKGDFGSTIPERLHQILCEVPSNVVAWSKDDLLSQRMGPLLIDVFQNESVPLRKHEILRLLIVQKPRGWVTAVQSYIAAMSKNSFYLFDIYRALRTQYRFSYVSSVTLKEIENLILMAATKHVTGHREPGVKLIQQTKSKFIGDPILPPREV